MRPWLQITAFGAVTVPEVNRSTYVSVSLTVVCGSGPLPKASNAAQQGERADVSVSITKNNTIYMDGKPVSQDELKKKMSSLQKRYPKISVTLKIDQQVEFKNVVSLLDVLKGLGLHNFNIAAVRE